MQAVLHETVKITPTVLEQLNSMSGFRVRLYVGENDEPQVTSTPLYEHLDILIDAIMTLVSLGIESEDRRARLGILRGALEEGATLLRAHCRKWPAKMVDRPGSRRRDGVSRG